MPSLADIVVKKDDNATDVTFAAQSPATPDTPAVFQAPALGATKNTRPEFRIGSTRRADGSYRSTQTFMYPYSVVDSTTGVTTVLKSVLVKRTVEVPAGVPDIVIDEAVSQSAHLGSATLSKNCDKQGFGPT